MNRTELVCLLAGLALLGSCTAEVPETATEVEARKAARIPLDPRDGAWKELPAFPAVLILQDLVEPRLMTPSTNRVLVQAMTDGSRIAFRLEWEDATLDDLPGSARFSDACAIQLPMKIEPDVPAPQMGEGGRGVEIVYWRASWQAEADGRPDSIQALYPNAQIDHYPFEAPPLPEGSEEQRAMAALYSPARSLGTNLEGPRDRPVEDLLAEGPGSLTHAPTQQSDGKGRRSATGWEVVLVRPLPSGLGIGGRSQVAFAIWQGSKDEVGSRKMRSVWVPLFVGGGQKG